MSGTVGDQPSLWEPVLPPEVLRLPAGLARVDGLVDDRAFFAPFTQHSGPLTGRPSTAVECCLRLMFVKFRCRLGFESLCAEVSDSIAWRRFCRMDPARWAGAASGHADEADQPLRRRGSGGAE